MGRCWLVGLLSVFLRSVAFGGIMPFMVLGEFAHEVKNSFIKAVTSPHRFVPGTIPPKATRYG
ncbi:hypothetical protein LJC36_03120, partial [Desulfovibrio sp. OttesenSCG-928-C14]|nr:hypothetical protein [Desulfovibrio sp. OttesenSCG-928-C14]